MIPSSSLPQSDCDLPDSAVFAIRVGHVAFPAISEGGGGDAEYTILLLSPDGTVLNEQNGKCSVRVSFQTETVIVDWDLHASGVAWLGEARLRSVLEPILIESDPAKRLKTMEPEPEGASPYDALLRAADRSSPDILAGIDPQGSMLDEPYSEASAKIFLAGMGFYPISIDGHRLIVVVGAPTGGDRIVDTSAFAVWEWTGKKLVPLVGGKLGVQGKDPTITVE